MLVCILAAAAAVGVVIASAWGFRKIPGDAQLEGETPRHSGSMLSALFLVAFAIAIVVPWSTADAARQNTYAESRAAVEASWSATGLPAAEAGPIQAQLRDYVRFVVTKEWPLMASGELTPEGWSRLRKIRTEVIGLSVTTDDARDRRNDVLQQLSALSAARTQRVADAKAGPPFGLHVLTILTGLAVIIFPFMAGERPPAKTVVPLAVMAALLGMGIYLAFNISHVFAGGLAVGPDAFDVALQELRRISGGG
jgi:hypothetical protein